MGFAIPGVGKEKELHVVTSGDLRGFIAEVAHLDFHTLIEGTVGNFFGISRGAVLSAMFVGLFGALWQLIPNLPLFAFAWIVGTMPIWLPVFAVIGGWKAWVWYVHAQFLTAKKPLLLEMKMARNTVKSPRGMEAVLSQLWIDASETTFMDRKWVGAVRPIFSLEMASFGGEVHFYIWTWENYRAIVEASFYGQYPEVELVPAEDYASKFRYDPGESMCYVTDYRLEPRSDAYPIKTYIEFELDKDPKEEYKVDPLAQITDLMSNLNPKEQVWIQIIFTCDKDARRVPGGHWWETESRYQGMVGEEIEKIRKELVGNPDDPDDKWKSYSRVQQYRVNEQVRAMERNMGKHSFNVGVRAAYIGHPDVFSGAQQGKFKWLFMPFANKYYLNQLRPRRWHTPFDYPWQDLWGKRWSLMAERFFDCYRRRSHFYPPYQLPHNTVTTETLATIWHPLSSGVQSPGIQRITAKKAEAPPNLPK